MATRHGDLELNQEIEFQQREWQVQRFGWFGFLLIIALGLVGVFGSGPLSDANAGDPDGPITVDYRRFVRQDAPTKLTFQVGPDAVTDGMVEVWLDNDYIHSVEVDKVTPSPSDVVIEDGRLVFQFSADELASRNHVTFSLTPQDVGILTVNAGLVDGPALSFRQLSYP